MSEPYLSEIKIVGFNFAPRGWAACNGQMLPIDQNQSLYSLLGTTYGGDGRTTFALPDLRSRVPIHFSADAGGSHRTLGQMFGTETVTLTAAQIPSHTHTMFGEDVVADQDSPSNHALAELGTNEGYSTTGGKTMSTQSILNAGGGNAHSNIMPYTTVNFVIALQGLFPPRS